MNNPYKRDKKPGRIGGDPLDNVVGESAGVGGQKVQPGKGPIMEGKTATVKVGQSSSYNVSSGLVNALDVVQGVSQVMGQAEKLGNQIDDARLTEMQKRISERQKADDWTDPESDGYLNDDAKLKAISDIQKEYEGGWLNDRYRAQYNGAVAQNKMAVQNLDFNGDLAYAQRSRAEQIAMGVPIADAQANTDKIYEGILKKHGKDEAKSATIKSAQLSDAALWAQAVTESSQLTVQSWQASGGLERLAETLPADIGYEAWQELALASMASHGGEGGAALWDSYNQADGKFEGPYADMLSQTLRRSLEPVYNQQVGMAVAEEDLNRNTAVSNAHKTAAVDMTSATDTDTGNAVVGDTWNRMMSMTDGGSRPLTPGQKKPLLGDFLGKTAVGGFQMDATLTNDRAVDMMNYVAGGYSEEIAAFVGMEPGSPEFVEYLNEQVKIGMSHLKAARTQGQTAADKDIKFQLSKDGPTVDAGEARKRINKDPFIKMTKGGDAPSLGLIDPATGSKYPASHPGAQGFGRMGVDFITTTSWQKDPKLRSDLIDKWTSRYEEYINGDGDASALLGLLTQAADDTPFTVSMNEGGGGFTFGINERGNAEAMTYAQVGAMLPYLELDAETGLWNPLGDPSIVTDTLKNLITASARDRDGRTSSAFAEQAENVAAVSRSLFSEVTANSMSAQAIIDGISADDGMRSLDSDQLDAIRYNLREALESGDFSKVAEITDDMIAGRTAYPVKWNSTHKTWENISPEALKLFGAGSLVTSSEGVQAEGAMSWWNPFDLSWFRDDSYSGMDDDVAFGRGGLIRDEKSASRLVEAGLASGVLRVTDDMTGAIDLADPDADRRTIANKLNEALAADGYQYEYRYDSDGNVNGMEIVNSPEVFAGPDMKPSRRGPNFAGDFDQAVYQGMDRNMLDTWNDEMDGTVLSRGFEVSWRTDFAPGADTPFYRQSYAGAVQSGLTDEQAHKLLQQPDFRRNLANYHRPARNFFHGAASAEESTALGNQVDETIHSFTEAGIPIDNVPEVRAFAEKLRKRTLSPADPIWKRTQEIAKAQGFASWETNPPLHALNMAIMAELFPEKASAIELTSPYSLVPKRGFRHGSGGDRDRDTQRGFDREMMFNLDAFHLVGQADVSSLRVPLLASSMTSSQSKGDPRTFVRVPRNEYKPQMGEVISGGATLSGKPVEIDQTDTIIHDAARLFGITD